jgi:hypothetical protein
VFDPIPLLRQLKAHNVEFIVVGGLAMVTHGSAHVTLDLDVCYSRTSQNIAALAAALAPLHPYLRGAPRGLPFQLDAATIHAGLNFTLDTDEGPLDVLGEVSGIGSYDQALAQSAEYLVHDLHVRVISLPALIASKRAAGRTKDKVHLRELEELRKLKEADE